MHIAIADARFIYAHADQAAQALGKFYYILRKLKFTDTKFCAWLQLLILL